jgi:hypothetical protein
VKTASILAAPSASQKRLLKALETYVSISPELFHHCYVMGPMSTAVYNWLRKAFRGSPNYFDHYCMSFDFLGDESFSKKVTILIDPLERDFENRMHTLSERAMEYAIVFSLSQIKHIDENQMRRILSFRKSARTRGFVLMGDFQERDYFHRYETLFDDVPCYFLPWHGMKNTPKEGLVCPEENA